MRWLLLQQELGRWRKAGRRPVLWWRDDDARAPSAALDRRLTAAAVHDTPLTLAVIPDGDLKALAARLAGETLVSVAQHGVDHQNRRDGPAAGEFPHAWMRIRVATQMRAGWAKVYGLPGAVQVCVPPWNDIHPELPAVLQDCGYLGWSAWAETAPLEKAPRVDAHIDLLRWRGGARFRGEGRILERLRDLLAERRQAGLWAAPIGLLTHHLDHDEATWRFLDRFIAWTQASGDIAWRALPDLLAELPAEISPVARKG
ncbi:polysaccharide deacetylase family protein [soil metagenome]